MSWRTVIVSNRCKLDLKLGYMMLAHPQMDTLFDFSGDGINTLVIEAPSFFRQFLQDISLQVSGLEGKAVLSQNNMPITFSKFAEVLDSFLSFEISKKSLVSKLQARLEAEALNERNYVRTMQLLGEVEQFIQELSFELPCTVACDKISIGGVIRSAGIEILDDYGDDLEHILDYMELTRELERDKLFVLVNLRSFYRDEEIAPFFRSILDHSLSVLLVDSVSKALLPLEKRVTVDADLCEF